MRAIDIYEGSDGAATTAYYRELEKCGPEGIVAMSLFRAQKASSRAKKYRGGIGAGSRFTSYRDLAYERKGWSLGLLCKALQDHGKDLGIVWGWARDPMQAFNVWVIYVELPQGQVSFHAPVRGEGPAYDKRWDGLHASQNRIVEFCDQVMKRNDPKQERLALWGRDK